MDQQPDIVLHEEQPVYTQPVTIQPDPVQAQSPNTPQSTPPQPENKTFSIITLIVALLSIPLVGIAYFAKKDFLLLLGVLASILSIILSVIAQSKKKAGEKFAFTALILGGLTLLSAILIFISTVVTLPG